MIIQSETTAALQINFCIIFDNIFFIFESPILQGSAERRSPGLVTFVTALAYHFCPALPAAFTQPGDQKKMRGLVNYPGQMRQKR